MVRRSPQHSIQTMRSQASLLAPISRLLSVWSSGSRSCRRLHLGTGSGGVFDWGAGPGHHPGQLLHCAGDGQHGAEFGAVWCVLSSWITAEKPPDEALKCCNSLLRCIFLLCHLLKEGSKLSHFSPSPACLRTLFSDNAGTTAAQPIDPIGDNPWRPSPAH